MCLLKVYVAACSLCFKCCRLGPLRQGASKQWKTRYHQGLSYCSPRNCTLRAPEIESYGSRALLLLKPALLPAFCHVLREIPFEDNMHMPCSYFNVTKRVSSCDKTGNTGVIRGIRSSHRSVRKTAFKHHIFGSRSVGASRLLHSQTIKNRGFTSCMCTPIAIRKYRLGNLIRRDDKVLLDL